MGDIADMLYEQGLEMMLDGEFDGEWRPRYIPKRFQPLRRKQLPKQVETKEKLFGLRRKRK